MDELQLSWISKEKTNLQYIFIIAVALILSCFFATGCETPKSALDEAIAYYSEGDFYQAKQRFEALPDIDEQTALFLLAIAAAEAYDEGTWLEKAIAFESFHDQLVKVINAERARVANFVDENTFQRLIEPTFEPFLTKINEINTGGDFDLLRDFFLLREHLFYSDTNNRFEIPDRFSRRDRTNLCNRAVDFCNNVFFYSLYHYYEEQLMQNVDITELEMYPFIVAGIASDQGSLPDSIMENWGGHMSRWRSYRASKLERIISEQPELDMFFNKTDDSISPAEIDGEGLYINMRNAPNIYRSLNLDVIPPFSIAASPEEARYVMIVSQSHSLAGRYDNGTDGYRTRTEIIIKDALTGKLLFSKHYSNDPPSSVIGIEAGSDTYANFSFDGRIETDEVLQALVECLGIRVYNPYDISNLDGAVAIAVGGTISSWHVAGLMPDGTVVAVGYNDRGQCDVSDWTDIIAISAGSYHTVGLKSDGTVVSAGHYTENIFQRYGVEPWTDIIAVSAGNAMNTSTIAGVKADGTVLLLPESEAISGWSNIIQISQGDFGIVGLRSDGTVVVYGDFYSIGGDDYGLDLADWSDVKEISAGIYHVVGLRTDGTVLSTDNDRVDVSEWTDIVSVSAVSFDTFGLKADGSVVVAGSEEYDAVSDWSDIIAIDAGIARVFGLKSDGTVVRFETRYAS